MRVLVGYASAFGSTKGVARAIGDCLSRSGIEADVRVLDEDLTNIDGYDAVVIGSAIHNQVWLPQAAAFVRAHGRELASRPLWLFSVSSVGDTSSFFGPRIAAFMRRIRREPKDIGGYRDAVHPRGHRNFAGAVDRSQWSLSGHLFLKAFGGSYGDHRDWEDIENWADGIARQLISAQGTSTG